MVGPRPNKLLALTFNLLMKLNPPHIMFLKKDAKMGKDTFINFHCCRRKNFFFYIITIVLTKYGRS